MNTTYHISVITTVFNTGKILLETASSVFNQTFSSFEWIIVDDGSTENTTIQLLNELALKNQNVKLIHLAENKGLPAARNTGIKNSTASYLFFLDADDLIDATFLEKAFLFLSQHKAFAFVNSYVKGFGAQHYKWTGGFHEKELFLKENRNTSCFMACREVFDQVLFDEQMRDGCEDWEFWLHAASEGFWGYTIPEYLFYYRRSANSKWATLQGKETLAQIQKKLQQKYQDAFVEQFPVLQLSTYSFGYIAPELPKPQSNTRTPLHLLCIFPWLQIGGGDQFNYNLLKGLKEKGWTVTIVTTLPNQHPWEEKFKEITNDIFHLANLSADINYASLIAYFIESRSPKAVFLSNAMYGYYLLPYLKQRFPALPIVDYIHCEDIGWYKGGYPYFAALYTKWLDKTFTTSANLSNWCIANGADSTKLEVCYINVDTDTIKRNKQNRHKLRDELGIANNTPLLLYVARLTQQKQPDVLVNTLYELKKQNATFRCVIIGDGPDKQKLTASLEKYQLYKYVSYLGSQPNEVVLAYMDAADIFFLPSKYEGIALSIYEAMAKELVVVGANVGGQAELVTKDCGFLIEPATPKKETRQYAKLLLNLLSNRQQLLAIGKEARARVEKYFSINVMINQMHVALTTLTTDNQGAKFGEAYLLILNRMLELEKQTNSLQEKSNSRIYKLVEKYQRPINKAKTIYHKLKSTKSKV